MDGWKEGQKGEWMDVMGYREPAGNTLSTMSLSSRTASKWNVLVITIF